MPPQADSLMTSTETNDDNDLLQPLEIQSPRLNQIRRGSPVTIRNIYMSIRRVNIIRANNGLRAVLFAQKSNV